MTRSSHPPHIARRHREIAWGRLCFGLFALFCLILILKNTEIAIEYMHRGLLLCAKTVIPSLFPFMVLSELIVSGGIGERLFQRITRPLQFLFGIPAAGGRAVLLGMLCGFPIGARCAIGALERGELSRTEAERVICLSSLPSSAFLISAVGVSLWGNRRFGLALYACVLVSNAIVGILFHAISPKQAHLSPAVASIAPPQGVRLFTDAVRSSTKSILLICAYVVFFSALVGTLGITLGSLHLPSHLTTLLFCVFEMSGGMSQASALGNVTQAALLSAFAAGWSGLSVHCQLISLCDGHGLSYRSYFLAKLLQSLLCMLLFSLVIHLFPEITVPAEICFLAI